MNTKFFTNVKNIDDLKSTYKTLAMSNHPDKGGDLETMQKINIEYSLMVEFFARKNNPNITDSELVDLQNVNEIIRKKIEEISNLPNIIIEICGSWIWVSGETKAVKDNLKEAGYKWASKKKEWYYATTQSRSRGKWTKKDIQNFYGSKKVETKNQKAGLPA